VSDDRLVEIVLIAIILAHVGALYVAFFRRRGGRPIRLLNLVEGGGTAIWWAPDIGKLFSGYYTEYVPFFVLFELAVAISAALAIAGLRVPSFVNWGAFAINTVFVAFALWFMFSFEMRMM